MRNLIARNGGAPGFPVLRLFRIQQEVFVRRRFRRQRNGRRRGEGDTAADELLEGPALDHAAGQAELQVVPEASQNTLLLRTRC